VTDPCNAAKIRIIDKMQVTVSIDSGRQQFLNGTSDPVVTLLGRPLSGPRPSDDVVGFMASFFDDTSIETG
jgi:hypothetical protein